MYYINFNWKKINGAIVSSNGIYDLVQFDSEHFDGFIENFVHILRKYFPDYTYDEDKYVYGLGVGGYLIINGPGPGGCITTDIDIKRSIERCEEKVRVSTPNNWKSQIAETIYNNLHESVIKQFEEVKRAIPLVWTNKCKLENFTLDEERESIFVDILKDDYKFRVALKCFSSRIAHQSLDSDKLSTFIRQGGKAIIGFQQLSGEPFVCEMDGGIYGLKKAGGCQIIFDRITEDFDGDYEYAAVVELSFIAYSLIHIVYSLSQELSNYDKAQEEERNNQLMKERNRLLNEPIDWDNLDLDEIEEEFRKEEPHTYCLDDPMDYADYFDDWIFFISDLS